MPCSGRWMVALPIVAGLQLSACQVKPSGAGHVAPAHIERIEGTDLSRITLTPKAAERLGIETAAVQALMTQAGSVASNADNAGARTARSLPATGSSSARTVVPYAAVLYDAHGDAWVYTSPAERVFVRHPIKIDYIDGDRAVLSEGAAVGTAVVILGAAELFGAEFEVGQ
jgi:hypothetical protein